MVRFKTYLPTSYSPVFEILKKHHKTAFSEFCDNHEDLFANRRELSQKTGICASQLSRLINSQTVPEAETLQKLANALPLKEKEKEELLSCSGDWPRFWEIINEKFQEAKVTKSELYEQINHAHAPLYKQKLYYCMKHNSKPSFELVLALCVVFNDITDSENQIKNAERLFHLAGYSFSGYYKLDFIKECIGYGFHKPDAIDAEFKYQIRAKYYAFVA